MRLDGPNVIPRDCNRRPSEDFLEVCEKFLRFPFDSAVSSSRALFPTKFLGENPQKEWVWLFRGGVPLEKLKYL
jgi:hypothetical protein